MMKLRTILLMAMTVTAAISCIKQEAGTTESTKLVTVQIALQAGDANGESTRSESPLFPEAENWIYDYYYVQFNAAGIAVTSGHRRATVTVGDLEVTDQVTLYTGACTLAILANISPSGATYGDDPGWQQGSSVLIADNIDTYKSLKFDMTQRINAAQAGTLRHMPMSGYWEGTISGSENMSVTLGRMLARLNVTLNNNSNYNVTKVHLGNASKSAYLFPQIENELLSSSTDYMAWDDIVTIPQGSSKTLYYYTAPNYNDWFHGGSGVRTYIKLTYGSGSTSKNRVLATDPSTSSYDGNDNLYMNTIYNFIINLK